MNADNLRVELFKYGREGVLMTETSHGQHAVYKRMKVFIESIPDAFIPVCGTDYVLTEAVMVNYNHLRDTEQATCVLYSELVRDKYQHFKPTFCWHYELDFLPSLEELFGFKPEHILFIPEAMF